PNIHGDIMLTTDAVGTNTSTGNGPASAFTYDPFGNILPGSDHPDNMTNGSNGWVGQHQKPTETTLVLTPIQMGARVYLPTLGRFVQIDPIVGGTANSYVYVLDPIGQFDLTGMGIGWKKFFNDHAKDIAGVVVMAGCIGLTLGGCAIITVAGAI